MTQLALGSVPPGYSQPGPRGQVGWLILARPSTGLSSDLKPSFLAGAGCEEQPRLLPRINTPPIVSPALQAQQASANGRELTRPQLKVNKSP